MRRRVLSPREAEVLRRLVEGERPAEIAGALGSSRSSVHTHLGRAQAKLGARTHEQLAAFFALLGGFAL